MIFKSFRKKRSHLKIKSKMLFAELIREASFGVFARPGRAILTLSGTALGVLALIGTYGLAQTASGQVVTKFDKLAATQVKASAIKQSFFGDKKVTIEPLPFNAPSRLLNLNGVTGVGNISQLKDDEVEIRTVAYSDPHKGTEITAKLYASSPGYEKAAGVKIEQGRYFDESMSEYADHVCLLGKDLAKKLHIDRIDQQANVVIEDKVFSVIGIIASADRDDSLIDSVITTEGVGKKDYLLKSPKEILISTNVGAAKLIAKQAKIAINPNNPDSVETSKPYEPDDVKRSIAADLQTLMIALGIVSLIIGAIGIANITLVSVLERRGEIGLRRALGATPKHIGLQFLSESAIIGFLGGMFGASLAQIVVVVFAYYKEWTPVIHPLALIIGIFIGLFVGIAAGLYPSRRAAKSEPVESLRYGL